MQGFDVNKVRSQNIAALEKGLREATPGPWFWEEGGGQLRGDPRDNTHPDLEGGGEVFSSLVVDAVRGLVDQSDADRDLIAITPTAIAYLIGEVNKLRKELKAARGGR